MVNTIFILDKTYNTTQILVGDKSSQRMFWNDLYTQEFDTGAETFEFSCYLDENVIEGNYVAFYYNNQYKLFTIMDMEQTHKQGKLVANCYCEIAGLSLLNNYVREFSGDMNCIQFFEHILNDTDWAIGKYSPSLEDTVKTIKVTKLESVWGLIEDYKDIFECELNIRATYENGHITGKYIDIYSDGGLGSPTHKRFEYGRNVTGITKKKELYDWCTGLILDVDCDVSEIIIEEWKGLGFTKGAGDIILNDEANRMYNAGRNHVIGVYEGDETDPTEAIVNAWKQLKERSTPRFDYEVTTALTEDEYEEIHLGDAVYVIDHSYTPPLFLEARVGKLELSFTDRTQNRCILTNYKEVKSKLLDVDYIKLTGTISDIVNSFFPITSDGIADGAITDGKIDSTYFQEITADIVSAGIGVFEDLYAKNLTVINADIENLRAKYADIENLKAGYAEIDHLKADVAEIDTLINGHLTSDNIQSIIITGDKFTVADAFIKDAMIDTINARKINTGVLNTNNVQIQSEDGSMLLQGNLQQFKDSSGKVRIQIGKDAQGNFTFALFSQDGVGVLIDENGIKEGAIGDGLIVDSMVSENANIQGGKLDIDSVVSSINNGTTTINSSKIYLDDEEQSLKVAFNQLKTKVETIQDVTIDGDLNSIVEQVTSNTTNINIMQGEISNLISNTTITKQNGQVVQLKDEYNSIKNTVDSHATKIGYLETNVDDVRSKQATMELGLNGFKTEVYDTYATRSQLNATNSNVTIAQNTANTANSTANTANSTANSAKTTANTANTNANSALNKANTNATNITSIQTKQSSLEQTVNGFKTEVSNTYVTKGDASNTYATKSLVNQTASDWTATFNAGYNKGIVNMNANGITVQHGSNKSVLDSSALKFYEGSTLKSKVDGGIFKFTDANGVELGQVGCGTWAYDRTKAISVLKATYGHSVALSAPYSSTATTSTVGILHSSHDHWVADDMILYQGINMSQPIVIGMMNIKPRWNSTMQYYGDTKLGHLTLWGVDHSSLGYVGHVAGNNMLGLGVLSGSTAKVGLAIYEDGSYSGGTRLTLGGPLQMNGWSMMNARSTMDLNAQSRYTKSLLSEGTNEHISYGTLSYSDNEIRWCWKENVFTYQDCDIDPVTDEWIYLDRYICYIELPVFMAENIEADYHINVSKMSWGDWRIREKNQYYFILESEENDFAFTFEVVAKLKDGATIDTNAYVANNSVSEVNVEIPQDFEELEIPIDNIQENINTGEE